MDVTVHSLKDKVRSSVVQGEFRAAPPPRCEESAEVVQSLSSGGFSRHELLGGNPGQTELMVGNVCPF